jgi:hypothetical protein
MLLKSSLKKENSILNEVSGEVSGEVSEKIIFYFYQFVMKVLLFLL